MVPLYYNKNAQAIFFMLMMGIVFFILGLALTPIITDVSNEAMSSSQLNCSNESISDQDKAVCTSIDIQSFLFFGTVFGLAGMLFGRIVS